MKILDITEKDEILVHNGLIRVYAKRRNGKIVRIAIDAPKEIKIELNKDGYKKNAKDL